MKIGVHKFGGASIESVERIKNVANIIINAAAEKNVVIISAMGKTTNALEDVWESRENPITFKEKLATILQQHQTIARELCPINETLQNELAEIVEGIDIDLNTDSDVLYDQIVSIGELMSTTMVNSYLKSLGVNSAWLDARKVIHTSAIPREGKVLWEQTQNDIYNNVGNLCKSFDVIISQGFIASSPEGITTTLGREGSDYTAAIFAYSLDAAELTIWKDVKGILTADPRKFDNVVKIDRLSYRESIEMTYYGAKVIHPKTIKPLQNKQIPLLVKSFIDPSEPGTLISSEIEMTYPPIVVIETNQTLIHFSTKDFSFIAVEHLAELFTALDLNRLKVNLMKNTAISFSICVTNAKERINQLVQSLENEYGITIDSDLELITIRHASEDIIRELKKDKVVVLEERAADTVQMVVKNMP